MEKNNGDTIRNNQKATEIIFFDTAEENIDGNTYRLNTVKTKAVFCMDQIAPNPNRKNSNVLYDKSMSEKVGEVEAFLYNLEFKYTHGNNGIGYDLILDEINLPEKNSFNDTETSKAIEAYYTSVFYNLVLWTGCDHRLNRPNAKSQLNENLVSEELVAEIATGFLCAEFKINMPKSDDSNHILYCMELLSMNKSNIVELANEASKATKYLFNLQPF